MSERFLASGRTEVTGTGRKLEMTQHSKRDAKIAYHEAGHAVAARVLGCRIKQATLSPPPDAVEGVVAGVLRQSQTSLARDADQATLLAAIETDILITLSGPIAEHFASGSTQYHSNWDSSDIHEAEQFCEIAIAISHGRCVFADAKNGGTIFHWDGELGTAEAKELMKIVTDKTCDLVKEHWPAICRVAEGLLVRRVLNQDDVDDLIEGDRNKSPAAKLGH